jgi:hypothetical protein
MPALLPENGYCVSLHAFMLYPWSVNIKSYYDKYGKYRYTKLIEGESSTRIYPNGKEEHET